MTQTIPPSRTTTDRFDRTPPYQRRGIRSLASIVAQAAWDDPDRTVLTMLDRHGGIADVRTARGLDEDCRRLAGRIRRVAGVGDRVIVPAMPGLRFHVAFLACLYAGVVAVPVPAIRVAGLRRQRADTRPGRLLGLCVDCTPVAAVVPDDELAALAEAAADIPELARISFLGATGAVGSGGSADDDLPPPEPVEWLEPETLAFLQYTSGSTSTPRGVMITHAAMLANQRLIRDELDIRPTTTVVSWLPTYHDMGLCAGLLQPLYAGAPAVLMEPETFLLRPQRWLEAMSGVADVVTAAPDFAYAFAAQRIPAPAGSALDLSGWRVALCGAEPVQPSTIEAFATAFADAGFRRAAFTPGYGLAESTLFVCAAAVGDEPAVGRYDRLALGAGRAVDSADPTARHLTKLGRAAPTVDIAVVDPATRVRCPDRVTGEIWVHSPSNGAGYWARPAATADTFGATIVGEPGRNWLRTGDLGFLDDDHLVIAGRSKELIIIRGVNYYPPDFERLAQSVPGLPAGPAAAFSAPARPDRVVVVVEAGRDAVAEPWAQITAAAVQAIGTVLPVQVEVVVVRAGQIPRTTSGKVRRLACAELFAGGGLAVLHSSHDLPGTELTRTTDPIETAPATPDVTAGRMADARR